MNKPPTHEEIAALARQTAREWLAREMRGPVPMNPYAALSPAARQFDHELREQIQKAHA